jgi:predicted ATP-grasp superfamily ATP-dependent carboligase
MRPALAMWSRYAIATMLLPHVSASARSFAEAVAEEAEGRSASCILATTDAETWALSRFRELLPERSHRVLAPHDAVARTLDRTALHDLAGSLGIPCLEGVRVDSPRAVEPALRTAQQKGLPAIVRPLVSWEEREEGGPRETERIRVSTIAELRRLLYEREDLVEQGCLIEPHPRGRSLSYCTVAESGVPLVEVFRERQRERQLLSGVSTLSRTIEPVQEMRERSQRLLRALKWQGPCLVEFLEGEDGELRLVNVLPRMWGSVQLAVDAGVDVPLLCYRLAEGSPLPPGPKVARAGVSLRWVVGDMQQLIGHLAGAEGYGPKGLRARARSLLSLASPRGVVGVQADIFDGKDPLPFLFEVQAAVKGLRPATE